MVDRRREDSSTTLPLRSSSTITCPQGMDESVFRSLPLDLQLQLAEDESSQQGAITSSSLPLQLDPHDFNQLSDSVRFDIIRGQQAHLLQRSSSVRGSLSTDNEARAAARRGRRNSLDDGLSAYFDDARFEVLRDQQEMILRQASVRLGTLAQGNPNDNNEQHQPPPQLDPEGLNALPDDVRLEVLRDQQEMLLRRSSLTLGGGSPPDLPTPPDHSNENGDYSNSGGGVGVGVGGYSETAGQQQQHRTVENEYSAADEDMSTLDLDGLNALPDDIRLEVLRNQQEQLLRQSSRRNLSAQNSGTNSSTSRRDSLTNYSPTGGGGGGGGNGNGDSQRSTKKDDSLMAASQDPDDGDYNGEYNESGLRHGHGQLIKHNGDRYEGQFWNGIYDGKGTLNFKSGTVYDGWWKMGRFQGHGTLHKHDGTVYTGNFTEGKQHGKGRCQFKSGDIYEGDWLRGSISGSGQYFFFDGANFDRTFGSYGFDKFVPNNNIHYEGEFKDGFIHGFGRFYLAKGKSFEGSFHRGKRHGKGKYQKADGTLDIYRFSFNKEVGDGVRWSKDRKKAWRISKGKIKGRMTLDEAVAHSEACGEAMQTAST